MSAASPDARTAEHGSRAASTPRAESASVVAGAPRPSGLGALLASPGVLAILFWGASWVATRRALAGFTPEGLVAARFLLGGAVVAVWALGRRSVPWPRREVLARCVVLGLVLGGHILVQAHALRFTTAIHSGWIVSFSAVAVTLGSAAFLGERLPARNWVGVALAVLGVALVASSKTPELEHASTGDLLVFASSFTWAGYTLLSKRPLASSGPWRVTPFVLGVAGLVALLASARDGVRSAPETAAFLGVPAEAFWSVLFLGLASSGLAFLCWAATIERFGALRAGLLIYLQPFVTLALSVAILGEHAGWSALVGGPLVLAGVAWASRR